MTTGDPEPQTEKIRQLFVTGDLEQLNALLDLEAGLPTDHTFRQLKRTAVTLFGPIVRDGYTCWLAYDGPHPVLSTYRYAKERTFIHFDPFHFSVSPDSPLQEVYDVIAASGVDPCDALRVGLLRAIPLPQNCLRLIFAVAGFDNPPRFWPLVDDFIGELHALSFHSTDLAEQPPGAVPPHHSPGLAPLPPRPEEPPLSAGLDLWFDWRAECKALGYKVTLSYIAAETGFCLATIKRKHALYLAERRP